MLPGKIKPVLLERGLHADVGFEEGSYAISLSGSVDYQVFLELKDDGKYAILVPTVEALGPKILREAALAVVVV
jgi:hypothetical protein